MTPHAAGTRWKILRSLGSAFSTTSTTVSSARGVIDTRVLFNRSRAVQRTEPSASVTEPVPSASSSTVAISAAIASRPVTPGTM
ncbi:MAG: hypothetical protein AMS19_14590 [Gemmatimonas sp. SG8_23]|nr:MAG: hypothetical protein AMS19_14590 [Gemmatimonas sp. SG8_23]